jgi:hypothetical protein
MCECRKYRAQEKLSSFICFSFTSLPASVPQPWRYGDGCDARQPEIYTLVEVSLVVYL